MMEKSDYVGIGCGEFFECFAGPAADGQVNFTGNIVDAACKVTNDLSNPLNVVLGDVARTAFAGARIHFLGD